jgi:radical SAM superfamily enzyme YgiQ (UPF0313 family)
MNALLIYPAFPDTFWSFKHALKFIHKNAAYPPLGLLTVGAMLPEKWSKRLVDVNVAALTQKDLEWADCVFISAMAIQRKSSHQIITLCKKAGLKVVAGGPLFNSESDQFEAVDHMVLNEAELTLPSFLADLERDCAKRVYRTAKFADIKTTPAPMWELIDLRKYASMNIQFSRGCPFYCDFCNVTVLFGHQLRKKTSAQIITELDNLYNLGWRGQVFFVDDNFIGNKRYLITELLPALGKWQKEKNAFKFGTEASLNIADDELLMKLMVRAGFEEVFIGIETPAEEGLLECNKKQNIYLPSPYYQRVKTFLREYNAPRIFVKKDFQRLLAFFRSCVKIGIFGRERFQFWNLFFWTLFRCPRFLPLTITFAIYGYHFRKICKL